MHVWNVSCFSESCPSLTALLRSPSLRASLNSSYRVEETTHVVILGPQDGVAVNTCPGWANQRPSPWTFGFWGSSWCLLGSWMILRGKGWATIFIEKQRNREVEMGVHETSERKRIWLWFSLFYFLVQTGVLPDLGFCEILLHPFNYLLISTTPAILKNFL